MIYGENQVRQFYVMNSSNTATQTWPTAYNGNRYYLMFAGDNVCTDKIKKDCIRDVRITIPDGGHTYKWEITFPDTSAVTYVSGDSYTIRLNFTNMFGFGDNDRYFKFVTIKLSSEDFTNATTASQDIDEYIASKFKELLDESLRVDAFLKNAIEVSVESSTISPATPHNNILVIKEKPQTITKTDIIRGMYRTSIANPTENREVFIDSNPRNTLILSQSIVARSTDVNYSNAAVVAGMEYFFMKGRADKYGYMGFPDINPTEMRVDPTDMGNYALLDIHYYFQEQGMLNQNSEKELTVARKFEYLVSDFTAYNSSTGAAVNDKIKITDSQSVTRYYIVTTAITSGTAAASIPASSLMEVTSITDEGAFKALENLIYSNSNAANHIVTSTTGTPITNGEVYEVG